MMGAEMNGLEPEAGRDPSTGESSNADSEPVEPGEPAATRIGRHQIGAKAMALAGFAALVLADGAPTNHTIVTIVHGAVS